MIQTRADVTLPVPPEEAFAVVADIEHADWLPAIRRLRHIGGPSNGVGARYEVEAGLVGRHLRGVLVCTELTPPKHVVLTLEEGLELTLEVTIRKVVGGCMVVMSARYSVSGRAFAGAVELASQGPARRETARACEPLAEARRGKGVEVGDLTQEGTIAGVVAVIEYAGQGGPAGGLERFVSRLVASHLDDTIELAAIERAGDEAFVRDTEIYEAAEVRTRHELGRNPTVVELAAELGWPGERVSIVGAMLNEALARYDSEIVEFLDDIDEEEAAGSRG